ncbi:MAG: peptide chain release factor N(5)-glutamine methyltransferase [Lachnospiraceae bacterium]|nr:peptide chain release factor N(5)-glutamine methyltransferase [Lachnospiraceae bacterium]
MIGYAALYEEGRRILAEGGVPDAALDARLLLETVCATSLSDLHVHPDRTVLPEQEKLYRAWIAKRAARIPLQHITGFQDFMGLTFQVSEKALIPRQDTEHLVEEALRELHDGMKILDIGTGSGCILLSLLHYSNGCFGIGTDISEDALALAKGNAEGLGISAAFGMGKAAEEPQARFLHCDLAEGVPEGVLFDIVVSNPPYIPSAEIEVLEPEVKEHDPRLALDGGEDGLSYYRRLCTQVKKLLFPEGKLFFEIGHDQGAAVTAILKEAGFREIRVVKDYGGNDRVVVAEKFT